ncbi:hypothetical protein ACTWQB_14505 [Piscibacillus sp. B03]|uniref:hypothetical protein n=1 Tax=Piscibacillus sp. B03 TaxID=3457430 RepID=UPI003FCDF532
MLDLPKNIKIFFPYSFEAVLPNNEPIVWLNSEVTNKQRRQILRCFTIRNKKNESKLDFILDVIDEDLHHAIKNHSLIEFGNFLKQYTEQLTKHLTLHKEFHIESFLAIAPKDKIERRVYRSFDVMQQTYDLDLYYESGKKIYSLMKQNDKEMFEYGLRLCRYMYRPIQLKGTSENIERYVFDRCLIYPFEILFFSDVDHEQIDSYTDIIVDHYTAIFQEEIQKGNERNILSLFKALNKLIKRYCPNDSQKLNVSLFLWLAMTFKAYEETGALKKQSFIKYTDYVLNKLGNRNTLLKTVSFIFDNPEIIDHWFDSNLSPKDDLVHIGVETMDFSGYLYILKTFKYSGLKLEGDYSGDIKQIKEIINQLNAHKDKFDELFDDNASNYGLEDSSKFDEFSIFIDHLIEKLQLKLNEEIIEKPIQDGKIKKIKKALNDSFKEVFVRNLFLEYGKYEEFLIDNTEDLNCRSFQIDKRILNEEEHYKVDWDHQFMGVNKQFFEKLTKKCKKIDISDYKTFSEFLELLISQVTQPKLIFIPDGFYLYKYKNTAKLQVLNDSKGIIVGSYDGIPIIEMYEYFEGNEIIVTDSIGSWNQGVFMGADTYIDVDIVHSKTEIDNLSSEISRAIKNDNKVAIKELNRKIRCNQLQVRMDVKYKYNIHLTNVTGVKAQFDEV